MDGPVLALRDILHTLNRQVALGGEADIKGRAALAGSVAIDQRGHSDSNAPENFLKLKVGR
jgi:hypothetical protein